MPKCLHAAVSYPSHHEMLFYYRCNVAVTDSPHKVAADHQSIKSIPAASPKVAAPIDASIDKWFFVSNI